MSVPIKTSANKDIQSVLPSDFRAVRFRDLFHPVPPRSLLYIWAYLIALNYFTYSYFFPVVSFEIVKIDVFAFIVFCVFPASFASIASYYDWYRFVIALSVAFLFSLAFLIVNALVFSEGLEILTFFYALPLTGYTFIGGIVVGLLTRPVFSAKSLKWLLVILVSIVSVCLSLYNLNFLSELMGN